MPKPETVLIQFRLDTEMAKVWDALAAKRGMKRNEWIKFMCSGKGGEGAPSKPPPNPPPSFSHGRSKTVVAETKRGEGWNETIQAMNDGRIQFGPPTYAPGSLAKRPKGTK